MITHHQAELLISARMDGPLDAADQRELAAHLATCPRCRTFARQVGLMRDDLRALPVLPPSMTVTRGVLEHVNAGRSPWIRFLNLFGAQPLPAFATVAATLVIVALLGTLVFNRLLGGGPERTPALLTAPTAQAIATRQQATRDSTPPTPTATQPPTPTVLPTLPNITVPTPTPTSPPTETPVPTATPSPTAPPPTATPPPPTATVTPAPTQTPAPTETPVPTETPAPTQPPAATETPVPTEPPTPLPTETLVPTDTPVPTETPAPTETPQPTAPPAPTDTPVPTETPSPTETPVPTETPSPTPTRAQQPQIVPRNGNVVEPGTPAVGQPATGPATLPAETPPATVPPAPTQPATAAVETPAATPPATEPSGQTIAPIGTVPATRAQSPVATEPPTVAPTATGTPAPAETPTTPTIPPIISLQSPPATAAPTETATTPATQAATTPPAETPPATAAPSAGDLSAAAETSGASNPGGMLVLNGDAVETADPQGIDLASLNTPSGSSLTTMQGAQGQSVRYCNANNECQDISSASAKGPHVDTPIGWLGNDAIYERVNMTTGEVSYRAVSARGENDHLLLSGGDGIAVRDIVIDLGQRLLVPGKASWVLLTADSGHEVGANPYGTLTQIRAYTSLGLIGFVAGGTVVVAPIDSPAAPVMQIAANPVGYDLSPDGGRLAVSDGATITVYRADGSVVGQFANSQGISVGGVLWLRQGIEFIDRTNGVIRLIDPATLS